MNKDSGLSFIVTLLLLAGLTSFANAESPTLAVQNIGSTGGASLNEGKVSIVENGPIGSVRGAARYVIDFVPGDFEVAGVNFDILMEGDFDDDDVKISNCGATVKGSHVSRCEFVSDNRIRVLVFSAPVRSLPASNLITLEIPGIVEGVWIAKDSAKVSNLKGEIINSEIL